MINAFVILLIGFIGGIFAGMILTMIAIYFYLVKSEDGGLYNAKSND